MGIGQVRLCQGDWAGAAAALEQTLFEADQIHCRIHGVQMARLALAYAYRMQGRGAEAIALYRLVAVEDEADGDGQAWIAFALAGLEQTLDDPGAFRAACAEIAAARNPADPLPLVQWQLDPATPDAATLADPPAAWTRPGATDDWSWCDLYHDCTYAVDDDGAILYAPHYYRDLWFNNVSAPRLMRPVAGDFCAETVCETALPDRPAMGGLVLWQDAAHYLRLGWGAHGPHSLDLMGCVDGRDVYLGRGCLASAERMCLRLERTGGTVRALCRADDGDWFLVGQVDFPVNGPLEIGVFATGMIQRWSFPAAYPDGTAIRFRRFRLWQVPDAMTRSDDAE